MDPAKLKAATDFLTANGIVTRAQWKARASKIDASKPENLDWNYNTLVIHHSGRSGETDPVKVQNKHMDVRKWDDVGYYFMVHPDGTIYEGRGLVFKGSHVELANTGKVGILVMGNFETLIFGLGASDPTVQQMEAVKRLGKALIKLFPGIKVLGGHKDWKKSTECPGNKDCRFNNFPVSWAARYGSVIPLGQDFIEHDLPRLLEVRRLLPPGLVHLVQDVHRHLQPRRGLGLLHQPLHQPDGGEDHPLARPPQVGEEPMLDRVVLRRRRRVGRYPDLDPDPIDQPLQVLLEQVLVDAVAPAAVAQ
jgi:hypothetical protein